MNPLLDKLQPYPFEKLRVLFRDVAPPADLTPISFGIGEPKHRTPPFILAAYQQALTGLSVYPATAGTPALRAAAAAWLQRRYDVTVDPATQILPVAGTREALFAIAQTIVDPSVGRSEAELERADTDIDIDISTGTGAVVICPNPFYQIYEGAALLAGATPWFVNCTAESGYLCDYDSVPDAIWQRTQLLYVCSPGNPTGATVSLDGWRKLFALSDRYGFVIASDECYSEIYFDQTPPLGSLQAARLLGRDDRRLLAFTSLSKRSNVPGLRSGFVAGDAALIRAFLLYRTYHGSALSQTVQDVSIAAWQDEAHVIDNRAQYVRKFNAVTPMLAEVLGVQLPDAAFYLWVDVRRTGLSDVEFARALYQQSAVTVLPGSYLARDAGGINPGAGHVRIALVAEYEECVTGASRIAEFCRQLSRQASVSPLDQPL